jgi:hypothetical protein
VGRLTLRMIEMLRREAMRREAARDLRFLDIIIAPNCKPEYYERQHDRLAYIVENGRIPPQDDPSLIYVPTEEETKEAIQRLRSQFA